MNTTRTLSILAVSILLAACNTSDPLTPEDGANGAENSSPNLSDNSATTTNNNATTDNNASTTNNDVVVEGDLELLEPATPHVFTTGTVTFRASSEGASRIILEVDTAEVAEFSGGELEFDASGFAEGAGRPVSVVALDDQGREIGRAEVTIIVDTTAPSMTGTTPLNLASGVALRLPLMIAFNEPLQDATVSATVEGEPIDVEWEVGLTNEIAVSIVEPSVSLPAEIRFSIESVLDRAGNEAEPVSIVVDYDIWQNQDVPGQPAEFATATGFADAVVQVDGSDVVVSLAEPAGWGEIGRIADGPANPVAERLDADTIIVGGIAPNSSGSNAFRSWMVTADSVSEGPSFAVGAVLPNTPVDMVVDDEGRVLVAVAAENGPLLRELRDGNFGPIYEIGALPGEYRQDDIALAVDGTAAIVAFPICMQTSGTTCAALSFAVYRVTADGASLLDEPIPSPVDNCSGRSSVDVTYSGAAIWMAAWTSTCSDQWLSAHRFNGQIWVPTFDGQGGSNLAPDALSEIIARVELMGAGGGVALGTSRPAGATIRLFDGPANAWTAGVPVSTEAGASFPERAAARFALDQWASPLVGLVHDGQFTTYRFNK